MDDLIFPATKKDGKFHVLGRKLLDKKIEQLDNGAYELVLRKKKKRRSNAQNSYYWGVMVKMIMQGLKEMGMRVKLAEHDQWMGELIQSMDDKSCHNFLKNNFIESVVIDEETGEIIKNDVTTKKLTTVEFMEYMQPIYEWAAEFLNIQIPLPNENFEVQ